MKQINSYILERLSEKEKLNKEKRIEEFIKEKEKFFKDKKNFLNNKFEKFSFGWSLESLILALDKDGFGREKLRSLINLLKRVNLNINGNSFYFPDFYLNKRITPNRIQNSIGKKSILKKFIDLQYIDSVNKREDDPLLYYVPSIDTYPYITNIKKYSSEEQFSDPGYLELCKYISDENNIVYKDEENGVKLKVYLWNNHFSISKIDFPEKIEEKLKVDKNTKVESNDFIICFSRYFANINSKK